MLTDFELIQCYFIDLTIILLTYIHGHPFWALILLYF